MRTTLLSLITTALLLTQSANAAPLDKGWWVILGTFGNPTGRGASDAALDHAKALAAKCGIRAFNDFSDKFDGFSAGFTVAVDGAFPSRERALRALAKAKPCIPSAYVKFGRYLGE